MRRSVTDVLGRGLDSLLANWPLILLKIAASLISTLIVIGAIVASVVPIAVSLGIKGADLKTPDDAAQLLINVLSDHWLALLIMLAVVSLALLVVVLLFSFVEGGVSQIVIDADRKARALQPARSDYFAFSIDRWMAGARLHWLPIFWIYNIAWGVAGIVLLVPFTMTLIGILLAGQRTAAIVVGCAGLAISLLLAIAVAIVTSLWCRKAIIVAVAFDRPPMEALREARQQILGDLGRHVAVAFVLAAIAFGAVGLTGIVSMIGSSDPSGVLAVMFIPMQIILSFVNGILSAAMSIWGAAAFAALTLEGRP